MERKASEAEEELEPEQPEEGQPDEEHQEQQHEEVRAASSCTHARRGPECHSSNKLHSSSAEAEAEKNQEQQVEDEQEQARSPEEENGRQQEQCPPCEGGPKACLLSTNIGESLR